MLQNACIFCISVQQMTLERRSCAAHLIGLGGWELVDLFYFFIVAPGGCACFLVNRRLRSKISLVIWLVLTELLLRCIIGPALPTDRIHSCFGDLSLRYK